MLFFFGRKHVPEKKQFKISSRLPAFSYTCVLCTRIRTQIYRDLFHLDSSGPPGVSSRPLGSHPSTPCAVTPVCHGVCAYTHTYTNIHSNPRQKIEETQTTHERHKNVEECSPSPRPSPAARTAAASASHACRAMHGVQIPVLHRRRGWRPRAAITTPCPKGTFMNAGSAVPLASAALVRAIHQWTAIWTCCQSTLLQTSHPKLAPVRADSSSQDNKLSTQARTTHQLSVECPCTPSQTHSCPKKLH